MTSRWTARAVLPLAVVLAGLMSACSSGSSGASDKAPFSLPGPAVATDRVNLPKSYKFDPPVITVKPGTTVTWTNHDDFPHTVQLLSGTDTGSHDLGIGKTVTITFNRPGTVYYHCSLHPAQMKGEVIVKS
jgi:plastocyanin